MTVNLFLWESKIGSVHVQGYFVQDSKGGALAAKYKNL